MCLEHSVHSPSSSHLELAGTWPAVQKQSVSNYNSTGNRTRLAIILQIRPEKDGQPESTAGGQDRGIEVTRTNAGVAERERDVTDDETSLLRNSAKYAAVVVFTLCSRYCTSVTHAHRTITDVSEWSLFFLVKYG